MCCAMYGSTRTTGQIGHGRRVTMTFTGSSASAHQRLRPICPVVRVDPYMAQHIPRFLENRRAEIETLRDATREGRFGIVRSMGHKLKGAGGTFGFDSLSTLGDRLERAAGDEDANGVLRIIEEICWYLEHVHVVYRRPVEASQAG